MAEGGMKALRDARVAALVWLESCPREPRTSTEYLKWINEGAIHVDALLVALEREPAFADFQVPTVASPAVPAQP
jgi:hypothetical protein